MVIPVYLWLKDDGGADIKGSVDVQDREGSHRKQIELRYEKITWIYKHGNIIHFDSWRERSTT